jgi:hypothetical protein
MRLLTIILVLFSFSVQAQFTGIGNKKFRRLTDFSMPTRNFGSDTVKAISIIDTSRSSGLILISKDSTAMYTYADTMNMYTTAKAWKFTPAFNDYWIFDTILGSDSSVLYNNYQKYNGTIFIKGTSTDTINGGVEINGTSTHQLGVKITGAAIDTNQSDIMLNPLGGTIRIDNLPNEGNANAIFLIRNSLTNEVSWYEQPTFLSNSATLNFGSIGAHAYEDLTLTVTGATDGDVVSIGIPNAAAVADASYFAWVSATNTVKIRCFNINGGTVNPPSALFKVKVFKD